MDKYRIAEVVQQDKGVVKSAVSRVIRNAKLQAEAEADQAAGKARRALGKVQKAISRSRQ
jgi:uncharacterized protein YjbJ (UPF0337 family)